MADVPESLQPLLPLIPLGVGLLIFLLNRHTSRSSNSQKLLVDDFAMFRTSVQRVGELTGQHQGGQPCEGLRSLQKSRQLITTELRRLGADRAQLEHQLPAETATELKLKFLEWKDSLQRDRGIIVGKPHLSQAELEMIDTKTAEFCRWLQTVRHLIVTHKIPVVYRD
jgi:hypothetical protein